MNDELREKNKPFQSLCDDGSKCPHASCPHLHSVPEMVARFLHMIRLPSYDEIKTFFINSFKYRPCSIRSKHNESRCPYYHSERDRHHSDVSTRSYVDTYFSSQHYKTLPCDRPFHFSGLAFCPFLHSNEIEANVYNEEPLVQPKQPNEISKSNPHETESQQPKKEKEEEKKEEEKQEQGEFSWSKRDFSNIVEQYQLDDRKLRLDVQCVEHLSDSVSVQDWKFILAQCSLERLPTLLQEYKTKKDNQRTQDFSFELCMLLWTLSVHTQTTPETLLQLSLPTFSRTLKPLTKRTITFV